MFLIVFVIAFSLRSQNVHAWISDTGFTKARAIQLNETDAIQRTMDCTILNLTEIYSDLRADCWDINITGSDNTTIYSLNFTTGSLAQESDLISCSATDVSVRLCYLNFTPQENKTIFVFYNKSTASKPNLGNYTDANISTTFYNSTSFIQDYAGTIICTNSSHLSNVYNCTNSYDSSTTTNWGSGTNSLPEWIRYDFTTPIAIRRIDYRGYGGAYNDENFTIAGSHDDSAWTNLYDSALGNIQIHRINLTAPYKYRYWRITVTKSNGDNYVRKMEDYTFEAYDYSQSLGSEEIYTLPPLNPIIAPLVVCFETKPICVKLDDNTIYYFDNVNINGNMHVSLNLPVIYPYLFTHTNNTIPVASAGDWYNVTFDEEEASPKYRITHTHNDATNDTFTIIDDGIYDISYSMSFADSQATPLNHIVMRVVKNGVEIEGSLLEEDSTKQYSDFTISNGAFVYLVTGDEIKFQFTSDATTVNLTSHRTYGDHHDTSVVKIKRIA